jgi:hypothetical protein
MPHVTKEEAERLIARVKLLESILMCAECGHLRSEHESDGGPCFGGRAPELKPGEGEYCDCGGFTTYEVDD